MATLKSQRSGAPVAALVAVSLALAASMGVNVWLALHHVNVTQFVILPPGTPAKQEPEVYHDPKNFDGGAGFCGMIDTRYCNHWT